MQVSELRNFGVAFSDSESLWPDEVKRRMRKQGNAVIMASLGPLQKIRFGLAFFAARRKARKLDLSDLRARGMTNDVFLDQQLEYVAAFCALAHIHGTERAVEVMKEVMDATAHEPLLLCLPEPRDVRKVDSDSMSVFREYFRTAPESADQAGCNVIEIAEDTADAIQFDVKWCIWFELAKRMGVPDACRPNCYADDLVFPEYFKQLGIKYERSQTLACGGSCCDFRFARCDKSDS